MILWGTVVYLINLRRRRRVACADPRDSEDSLFILRDLKLEALRIYQTRAVQETPRRGEFERCLYIPGGHSKEMFCVCSAFPLNGYHHAMAFARFADSPDADVSQTPAFAGQCHKSMPSVKCDLPMSTHIVQFVCNVHKIPKERKSIQR